MEKKPNKWVTQCVQCDKDFEACRDWHRHCSKACRIAHSKEKKSKAVKFMRENSGKCFMCDLVAVVDGRCLECGTRKIG